MNHFYQKKQIKVSLKTCLYILGMYVGIEAYRNNIL